MHGGGQGFESPQLHLASKSTTVVINRWNLPISFSYPAIIYRASAQSSRKLPPDNIVHEAMSEKTMNSTDVIKFYTELDNLGIDIGIDGGWGVDALLGEQTRPHADLDIFIQEKDVLKLRELLEAEGYKEIKLEIARPHNFVLGDDTGREIDVHVIVFDDEGNVRYGPIENGERYLASMLGGEGIINGRNVKCISPEWMVKFHTGYTLRESDFKDVSALCKKFSIDLPKEYIR